MPILRSNIRCNLERIIVLGIAIAFNLSVCNPPDVQAQPLPDTELERLANLQENEIDLGEVALLLASEAFPGLDVQRYSAQLDRLAEEIRQFTEQMRPFTKSAVEPDYPIRSMNTYLYKRLGFHYDRNDLDAKQLKNRYLNGVLDTKAGSCTTLPLLYLALAQRLRYPVYPVAAPQHLFCRYRLPDGTYQNIEATAGGWSSDEEYIKVLEISERGLKSGTYMENMTYRQLLGDLISENGGYWARQKDLIRAVKYMTMGLRLNPKSAEVWRMLGYVFHKLADEYEQMSVRFPQLQNPTLVFTKGLYHAYSQDYRREGNQALERAYELGVAPPAQDDYWVRQKELAQAFRKNAASSKERGVP